MDLLAAELGIDPVELRLLNAIEPGDQLPTGQVLDGLAAGRGGDPRGRRDPRARARSRCRATRSGCPAARATRPGARASAAASASRSGSRTSASRRGSTTTAPPACSCMPTGAPTVHCAAAEVGQGVGGRDPAGRARRARHERRHAGAAHDRDGRLGRLDVGVADDLDGGRRRARRVPGGARGARREAAGPRSTSSASTGTRRPAPLDPETGQVHGERAHVALARARCGSSSRSTSSSGSRASSGSGPRRTSARR